MPLALALALLTGACGGGGGGSSTADASPASAGERAAAAEKQLAKNTLVPLEGEPPTPKLPVTVDSSDGREVKVKDASRILPLNGGVAEIVFTLGLGDRVVGRDITATFAEAKKLPQVTKAHDVSAESVLSLRPTVVLADTDTGPSEAIDQIRDAGVPVVVLDPATELADVPRRTTRIAEALGVPDAGKALNERMSDELAAARAAVPKGGKPRVAFLYMRGSAAVYLIGGKGSGADSLIEAAGAVDAGKEAGLDKPFTPITSEALVRARPDVILMMTKGLESVGGIDGLVDIPGIGQTPAGMDRRVVDLEDGVLLGYGPRMPLVIDILVDRIHRAA
ncbi:MULTISPECIES: ABC transporter substrate-binding protein [unclassified Streptomyces]|uniref:heme/hemin ABC transporter substrate-binding protein n=1 Tax=unclassified Streptomyces TaxID=2593676 RepID=UPI00236613F4|nr:MULTISPECIES: ABC transporter substrate-binding protein [unclassified Streptomyces]MDF3145478.1 ABC transporter substrate-binding protein [Streptomyces sp. T21Q-yed]WDF42600.1 ABC transporter substrate-binding protein [Streptomyces sp. T12]